MDKYESLEQEVLRLRKGEDGKPLTLEEVSQRLGITRERARQIEAKALAKENKK